MKRWHLGCLIAIAGGAIVLAQSATAHNSTKSIWARLIGLQEVPVVLTRWARVVSRRHLRGRRNNRMDVDL